MERDGGEAYAAIALERSLRAKRSVISATVLVGGSARRVYENLVCFNPRCRQAYLSQRVTKGAAS